ncbi:pyridoxamine 5'-phosphate oxidase [Nocardioides donggukensis]|uniref:Pyridoxine/pyridoxamine 5'-phosphate oxidase n=1 Tax=Nocardioides donggukensis TaxID=2774019 RepID=A0A927KAM4_9ACTN|nr:pyridoxamine 5'-phosphate oxidase [Nocardioides donggukensis]MBD8870715.1 pyridoxamine 5'-phosphate oxidase [Nocardioides donggukensis]
MRDELARLREEYADAGLAENDLTADPLDLFDRWLEQARAVREPNAMVLSTVSADGRPSSRTVLLKGLDERGFVFFTNLGSRKGRELAATPACALLFGWYALERQVRVEGTASELPRDEVAAYFGSRPRGSQLGAWASPQSEPITAEELAARYAAAEARMPAEVPVPEFWGGYVVAPEVVEFWQGRRNRMHDRWCYRRPDGTPSADRSGPPPESWTVTRLAP